MQREAVMTFQAPSGAVDRRSSRAAYRRDGRTPFVGGVLALLWVSLIVLLVPVVILLVGLPIAAILRAIVEAAAWIAALSG